MCACQRAGRPQKPDFFLGGGGVFSLGAIGFFAVLLPYVYKPCSTFGAVFRVHVCNARIRCD